MPVGGYLDVVFCFELIFHQTMFITAWVCFIHWQLGFFEARRGCFVWLFIKFLLRKDSRYDLRGRKAVLFHRSRKIQFQCE